MFAAKYVAAASCEDDALAPQTLSVSTAAPPAGAVHTRDTFRAPRAVWFPARTAAAPSSPPDSPWTRLRTPQSKLVPLRFHTRLRPGNGARRSKDTNRIRTTKCKINRGVLTSEAGRGDTLAGGSRFLRKVEHAGTPFSAAENASFSGFQGELVAHPYTKLN